MRVNYVQLSAIAHATEDADKVARALGRIFPKELQSKSERRMLKGHFGNRITTVRHIIRGRSAESLFEGFWHRLSTQDRETLIAEIETRLDDQGRLHLRLDKQSSFRGEFHLKEEDPIKMEIGFQLESDPSGQIREFLQNSLFVK